MPKLLTLNLDAVQRELSIWHSNHRGMEPYIIMSAETRDYLDAETSIRTPLSDISYPRHYTIFTASVAICNSLKFGEFKIR